MDEGFRISYQVLEVGVPIYASDGQQVGTVDHVVAAVQQDIFHGIVMRAGDAQRFVPADQVAELHEFGVDLLIDAAAASALLAPGGQAPAYQVHEPGVKPSRWSEIVDLLGGKGRHSRGWQRDE
jgi:hypothetical protein